MSRMPEAAGSNGQPPPPQAQPPLPSDSGKVFRRLLRMLKPYRATIALGVGLLVLSAPCELFPAVVWKFVTDDVVLQQNTSPWMQRWFSFGGAIESRYALLLSAVCWLMLVYLVGELLGTLD